MSRTYNLVCHDCKTTLWISQSCGSKHRIYTTREDSEKLASYLQSHLEHKLQYIDSEESCMLDYKDCSSY